MLLPEPTSVAAASREGVPSSHMVLPEPVSADGFVCHTKCGSRKTSRSGRTSRSLESLRHAKGVFFFLSLGFLRLMERQGDGGFVAAGLVRPFSVSRSV